VDFPLGKPENHREQLQENQDPPGEYEKKWKKRVPLGTIICGNPQKDRKSN
jgi:hypothetical protein